MNPILGAALAASGLAALHAARTGERFRRFYVLKPLTTTLILVAAGLAPGASARTWMRVGLVQSLFK